MPRSRKSPAEPSPADAERQRRDAIEQRARTDYERSTGLPWSDVQGEGRREYLAMAERALRAEAAQAATPLDRSPAEPTPAPAPARGARPLTVADLATIARGLADPIRDAINRATGPLAERIAELERLAGVKGKAAPRRTAKGGKPKRKQR